MLSDYPERSGGAMPTAIRAIRLALSLNGTAFGRLIGATAGEISKYESGMEAPGTKRLVKLIRVAPAGCHREVLLRQLAKHGLSAHDISTPLDSQRLTEMPHDASIQQDVETAQ